MGSNDRVRTIVLAAGLGLGISPTWGVNVTLSDAALMSLDYNKAYYYSPDPTATIVGKRDVPGPGVEFDIRYIGLGFPDYFRDHLSSRYGGSGDLVGLDISAYENFQLKFTLLAVDGVTTPGTGGVLIVGAYVNGSVKPGAYQPQVIDLGSWYGTTAISSTTATYGLETVDEIGFTTHLGSGGWSPSGATITLLVQPAPGAVQIPEPAGLTLMAAGALGVIAGRGRKDAEKNSTTDGTASPGRLVTAERAVAGSARLRRREARMGADKN